MSALPPGSTIGILGGGQLGRMLAMAAARIGYKTHVYAPEGDGVAFEVAGAWTVAAYDDEMALNAFGNAVDVVTYEFENVPLDAVRHLAEHVSVRPGLRSLEVAQDRLHEKGFAAECGVPLAPYAEVRRESDLADALAQVGGRAILKTATQGYDGRGQVRINVPDEAAAAWTAIGGQRAILEAFVDFTGEFSVLLVRAADGTVELWDCPENRHEDGILATSTVPADPAMADAIDEARTMAVAMAQALDHVGVIACEFFVGADGPLFNELAPRVHNSGHWTIEGARTCQFENHIRAVVGLPLGDPARRGARVTMRNLIGEEVETWPALFADPEAHVHLYGKGAPRAGRKMGHVTWVDDAEHGDRGDRGDTP